MGSGNRINDILNPGGGGTGSASSGEGPPPSTVAPSRGDIPSIRQAPPKSPFGGTILGAVGGTGIKADPDHIESLGKKLVDVVGSELTAARRHLNDKPRSVEAGSFTTFGAHLAHAYVQATEYADTDLITKAKQLVEVHDGLKETALIWRAAEEANRVRRK